MKYKDIYMKLFNSYSFKKYLYRLLFDTTFKCNILLKKISITENKYRKFLLINKMQKKYSCVISINAILGNCVILKHPVGVVIGEGAKIENNVIIYQNVTIGQKNGKYPLICANSIIYPNAIIVGDIIIGYGSIIGANSFIDFNTEQNSVYAAIRAKRIK